MFFLNLMLNAFSSVIRLTQVMGDAGPSPAAPAVPPIGPAVPIPAAGGGIANGYPYPAPNAAAPIAAPAPSAFAPAINAAPVAPPALFPAGALPAAAPAPPYVVPPVPGYIPNNGFSNYALIANYLNNNAGSDELWYQAQIANYLHHYSVADATFNFQREYNIPWRRRGSGAVDFYLSKTIAAVNQYQGLYELKVFKGGNIADINNLLTDYKVDMNKIIDRAQCYAPAVAVPPILCENVALLYIADPNRFFIGGLTLDQLQQRSCFNNPASYLMPYMNHPAPPAVYPAYGVNNIAAYAPTGGVANMVNPTPYSTRRPVGGNPAYYTRVQQPLPGIIHFFQPVYTAATNTYCFQEVFQVASNLPLLCVYNGS